MALIKQIKRALRLTLMLISATRARLQAYSSRPPRFAGVYSNRAKALASLPQKARNGYDNDQIVEVSFNEMQDVVLADYPVVMWLGKLLPETGNVIDAGGHLGTKYLAFQPLLDLNTVDWTVYDLPAIVQAGRGFQQSGKLPAALRFEDDLAAVPECDLVLASGLLQYLDVPLAQMLNSLPRCPRFLLLNKVALRDGPSLVTLEQIGSARVPYQIRNRAEFLAELEALGYVLRDEWEIAELSHTIRTHPWHGASQSWGGLLELRSDAVSSIVSKGQSNAA